MQLRSKVTKVGDAEAIETLKKALAVDPAYDYAAASMSLAYRYQGKYEEALPFARKAVELNAALDTNWLELADCYASMRNRQNDARDAYARAATEAERHLVTDATEGPAWMLLALYKVKTGEAGVAPALIEKAERLGAIEIDSQLCKARILELLGNREKAFSTLAACFRKGATDLQVVPFPEMGPLRKDPRYQLLKSSRTTAKTELRKE